MADFNVRSDSVNVEQIMDQIRARIREKRGVDYTEQQIRELASVKLEKFIDPTGVRSDLLQQFRQRRATYEPPEVPNYAFEESSLFDSHRGIVRVIRNLLKPILKLFFNPNPLIQALNIQAKLNTMAAQRNAARNATEEMLYEVVHNLVVELTRTGIEVKSLKMRVESLASRVEFNERRARALESVVVYKPSNDERYERPQPAPPQPHQPSQPPPQDRRPQGQAQGGQPPASGQQPAGGPPGEGPGQRSRRRRRRRGRRGGGSAAAMFGAPGAPPAPGSADQSAAASTDDQDSDGGPEDIGETGAPGGPDDRADAGQSSTAAPSEPRRDDEPQG